VTHLPNTNTQSTTTYYSNQNTQTLQYTNASMHTVSPMHQYTTNTNIKFSMDLNSDKEYFQETKNKWIQELQTANRSVEEVAELLAKFYVSIKSIIVFYFTSSHSNFR